MSRFNTGNPLGSGDPRDLDDNAKNMDLAVNSDGDTFQDRMGKSRLTWAGIVKAGSGDPAIAVDAAARAEAASSQVQQDAAQIAADAAQQAVDGVVVAVDGAADRAEVAAETAESAATAASASGALFDDTSTGIGATVSGQYFLVKTSYPNIFDVYLNNAGTAERYGSFDPATSSEVDAIYIAASDLFRFGNEMLFPAADLAVRRYTGTSTFNDYPAGYSQTATPEGLLVQIPNQGSSLIKHYLNTSTVMPEWANFSVRFEIKEPPSSIAGVGIGYIAASGVYVAYLVSAGGNLLKIENFARTIIRTGLGAINPGDEVRASVSDGVLSFYVNDNKWADQHLSSGEFRGALLFAQEGFYNYVVSLSTASDPFRKYVDSVLDRGDSTPEGFYEYSPTGSLWGQGRFRAYSRVSGQTYVGFDIGLRTDMSELVYVDYWRIEQAYFYTYNGSEMVSTGLYALGPGESECVWRRSAVKDDFTGGYHGDEIAQSVLFFADGVPVAAGSSSIPLTECREFSYLIKSTMHETAEGGVPIAGHPVECYHTKHTVVSKAGYETFNRLTWVQSARVAVWYSGISCVGKPTALNGYSDEDFTPVVFDESGETKLEAVGPREFYGWGNEVASFTTSKQLLPEGSDSEATMFIHDRSTDSKYYRSWNGKTPAVGDQWESVLSVTFKAAKGMP